MITLICRVNLPVVGIPARFIKMIDWERVAVWSAILAFCLFFWVYFFRVGYNLVIRVFGG